MERAVRSLPVDAPAMARYRPPNKSLLPCASGMVIEQRRSFIESSRVPGIRESMEVQVVAKLVAKSTQEGSKRGHLFAYRRLHPHANKNGVWVVIAEKLDCRSLSDTEGSGGKNPNSAVLHFIKICCTIKKVRRNSKNLLGPSGFYRGFDGSGNSAQSIVLWQPQSVDLVAFRKKLPVLLPGWRVG